jgi:hypothetical protein
LSKEYAYITNGSLGIPYTVAEVGQYDAQAKVAMESYGLSDNDYVIRSLFNIAGTSNNILPLQSYQIEKGRRYKMTVTYYRTGEVPTRHLIIRKMGYDSWRTISRDAFPEINTLAT